MHEGGLFTFQVYMSLSMNTLYNRRLCCILKDMLENANLISRSECMNPWYVTRASLQVVHTTLCIVKPQLPQMYSHVHIGGYSIHACAGSFAAYPGHS